MSEIWKALEVVIAILGTGVASFALARLPRSKIRLPLYLFVASGVFWAVGDLIADGATTMATKQLGITILYSGSIMMPALWWSIVLRWADTVGVALPMRSAAWWQAPLWWSGAMWLVMLTNPLHGTFMSPVIGDRNVYQPLWFVMTLAAYGLTFAALAVEISVALRAVRPVVRRQAAFLIGASSFTLVGNWLYVANLTPVNPTVAVLSLAIAALIVGMARDGLFGVMPAALRAVARAHPEGVVIVESDGYVAYANGRAHELLAPATLRPDRPLLDILRGPSIHPETSLAYASPDEWWRALGGPTGLVLRVDARAPRWVQVVASSVEGRRTVDRGRFLQLTDVTERRQAEAQRGQRRRLDSVTSLARSVSRDFQNAFTIVRANTELLASGTSDDIALRRLARISEATRVGVELAHELEAYTGEADFVRLPVDVSDVLSDVCRRIDRDRPMDLDLHYRRPNSSLVIEADSIQIRECFYNLVLNAVEATEGDDRQVEVVAGIDHIVPSKLSDLVCGGEQPPGEYVYVEIRDEGGGMDPEVVERAFEPFFSTREKNRGNGLATVLGIARAHDAAIALYNDPGWGCTFVVYLPVERR